MMSIAGFFQKNEKNKIVKIITKIYCKFFLRSNKARIKYLRDCGANIGENVYIGNIGILGSEPWLVEIGNNTYFSGQNQIITHDGAISELYYMGLTPKKFDVFGKVKIGRNCFLGHDCVILKDVTVGDNCIIGAYAVVTKDIPSGSVAVGIPARVISTVEEFCKKNEGKYEDVFDYSSWEKRKYTSEKYL